MNQPILLSRDDFREGVFARDGHCCVICQKPAQDAHHILERRLWPDGGYYLNNGASVCGECHIKCETTEYSVEYVRERAGITKPVIPPHLYRDQTYDKWGNPTLANGNRLKGELFFDESVQKILAQGNALQTFCKEVKYPRTHHVPWSEGVNDDDRVLASLEPFVGKRVIATEKMDGENTTMYNHYIHARSIDGRSHPSRDWVKNFWAKYVQMDIPDGWRVCGENLYAKHSIGYNNLPTYFMGFSIWDERNVCLDWDTTLEWFDLLWINPVPVLYDGIFDLNKIQGLYDSSKREISEGYCIRLASEITYSGFKKEVGKFVRKGHVQTAKHWMQGQRIEPNGLAKKW